VAVNGWPDQGDYLYPLVKGNTNTAVALINVLEEYLNSPTALLSSLPSYWSPSSIWLSVYIMEFVFNHRLLVGWPLSYVAGVTAGNTGNSSTVPFSSPTIHRSAHSGLCEAFSLSFQKLYLFLVVT
jgi:hypothetical protein